MGDLLKMSPTQMIITGVFLAFIVIGMVTLAVGNIGSGGRGVRLVLWGTTPSSQLNEVLDDAGLKKAGSKVNVQYVQKDPVTYEAELIEALASGSGPDIFFLPHELILKHKNKIAPIPFEALPLREYNDTFIKEGKLFVFEDGIYAVPFIIDPMVMYWNTTHFSNAGIPLPPQYWDEIFSLIPRLTVKNRNLDISQSALAIGEAINIEHSEEILSALLLQNNIAISKKAIGGGYVAELLIGDDENRNIQSVSVLNFYTQFANSTNDFYTWNRSLPEAQNMFIQTDLAMYLGFASELNTLRQKNPNLTFDVAKFPQARGQKSRVTYGRITGLAIPNASPNKQSAYEAIRILTSESSIKLLTEETSLPPVRLDTFVPASDNAYMPVFQEMALWSEGWLSPDPRDTRILFSSLIQDITSGRVSTLEAIRNVSEKMNEVYRKIGL